MEFPNMKIEGAMISHELLCEIYNGDAQGQKQQDFRIKNDINNEMSASRTDTLLFWEAYQRSLQRADNTGKLTAERFIIPMLETMGFKNITYYRNMEDGMYEPVNGQPFPVSHRAGNTFESFPLHIMPAPTSDNPNNIEKRVPGEELKLSPHSMVQEYLNRTDHLWGIITNGNVIRILRNCSRLSKLYYIEFNIKNMLETDDFQTYQLMFRLLHYSRWYHNVGDASECWLEKYYQQSIEQGGRIRYNLRDNVDYAIRIFANGFMNHPHNTELREKIRTKQMSETDYYRQLLKLIYRFLFLMTAEDRKLVGPDTNTDTDDGKMLMGIYSGGYSIRRLRSAVELYREDKEGHYDIWEQIKVTFSLYSTKEQCELPGITYRNGGLFGSSAIEDLEQACMHNDKFVEAFRRLSLFWDDKAKMMRRISYAYIDVEELGSVYESLLDFHPVIETQEYGEMNFRFITGTERKSTGSYYTRQELVGELIKNSLDPLIEERLQAAATQRDRINAILNIKVCDPAAGTGHFLLAVSRRLASELANIITQEEYPSPAEYRKALRDVIKHCIYGVELNPLAVDLCKLALCIEGHNLGEPLTFLDHRIKHGNSLVGLDKFDRLADGIPDDAFKHVTGDDKAKSNEIKGLNRLERKEYDDGLYELGFDFKKFDKHLGELAQTAKEIDMLQGEKRKEAKYHELLSGKQWLEIKNMADMWTAAFFYPLTADTHRQLVPTHAKLMKYISEKSANSQMLGTCGAISDKLRFFHWELEYPEIFAKNGFDLVIGNPPWEMLQIDAVEFFSTRIHEISKAANMSKRNKLIEKLKESDPVIYKEFKDEERSVKCKQKFIHSSNRFPFTSFGRINLMSLFAELGRNLINDRGNTGTVLPTGIATDSYNQKFFRKLSTGKSIISLFDFVNREKLFPSVVGLMKFCLLSTSKKRIDEARFAFFLTNTKQLDDKLRKFTLSAEDISLLNPNTKTLPVFRTSVDAEITKKIYERVPVMINEQVGDTKRSKVDPSEFNPWGISFKLMFMMNTDSGLFHTESAEGRLPLYEAKMMWLYDHRYGSYAGIRAHSNSGIQLKRLTEEQYNDPECPVRPWYWVDEAEVAKRLQGKWSRKWFIGFRDITNATSERTSIFSILPYSAVSMTSRLIFLNRFTSDCYLLAANCNSLAFDYVARQKIGGTHMSNHITQQLPVIPPDRYTAADVEFIKPRVLELVYTAYDLKPFAVDMGYDGEPFAWDADRRHLLMCELDAYYAKLYGLTRDELRYVLDPAGVYGDDFPGETFRVLKQKEIKRWGEYRTGRRVLDAWDAMC